MARPTLLQRLAKALRNLVVACLAIAALLVLLSFYRGDLNDSRLPKAATNYSGSVTATWLGTSTILFDDGQTQILVDSFLTRARLPTLLFRREIQSDAATVNNVLHENHMTRLAAIVVTHSHYDHVLDLGAVANRTNAIVLGSPSTASIARGAGVTEPQISIVTSSASRDFGNFQVELIPSEHSGYGWQGSVPLAGKIDTPLETPATVDAFRVGQSFSVVIRHPEGTAIVQSSAGLTHGALQDVDADAVFLGTAMLSSFGRPYAQTYWNELVTATGATRVFPIHFDDLTQSPIEPVLMPKIIDNFFKTEKWLLEFQYFWDSTTTIEIPEYGQAIPLYGAREDTST